MKPAVSAALLAVWLGACGPSETASSTTASSTAAAGSGGGNGGAGAGGSTPVEDCLDGIDTDGDGAVDCEDPDCQLDFECVDAPVSGWSGALRVQKVRSPAATAPGPCPGGKPPAVYHAGPSAPECAACQCELVGAKCNAPQMTCSTGTACLPGFAHNEFQETDTACANAGSPPGGYKGCRLTKGSALVESGVCEVGGGGLATKETWADEVRVCAAAGAGCGAAQVCAPKAPKGFEPAVCMAQEGGALCPAGWTGLDLSVYEGGEDNRKCSPCTCDTSAVHCKAGSYTLYPAHDCPAAGATKLVDSNACTELSGFLVSPDFDFSFQAELGTAEGIACSVSEPSGSVEPVGHRRICCRNQTP
ncbi:hypothetical protein WME79_37085 [Sorangium sp. So ce726]|uniref:hypothetical protein n=1 Tax=Sorangium sp. So ce726 TaxID=3133319 RepID=UPI003F624DDF